MLYKAKGSYQEIEIFQDGVKIGEAEVDLNTKMLSGFNVFEPYQNKGYGTQIAKDLCDAYGVNCLWVEADNARAIHVYEKCGFKIKKPSMYLMVNEEKFQ